MKHAIPALALLTAMAAACTPPADSGSGMEAAEAPADARPTAPAVSQARAVVRPASGSDVRGTVSFETREVGGITVAADLRGLEPGAHAFHVHEHGDCTAADATSAGPHFPFVSLEDDAEPDFITGNLGEVVAGEDGTASVTREIPVAELNGPRAIPGRAVVVHRSANDTTAPPAGDTGPRVACGVIGIAG